mmetsp:Transcript_17441/g.49523  ORF Transcript_17441/g.49523 Transcript_17441/m.49523 type:complete len:555 (-) Transcript_17441:71-1735(-)
MEERARKRPTKRGPAENIRPRTGLAMCKCSGSGRCCSLVAGQHVRALRRGRGRAPEKRGAHPIAAHGPAVAGGHELEVVDRTPNGEARQAAHAQLVGLAVQRAPEDVIGDAPFAELQDTVGVQLCGRLALADVGHGALVHVRKALRLRAREHVLATSAEELAQVLALLERHLRGGRIAADRAIADSEDLPGRGALDPQALVHEQATAVGLAVVRADLLAQRLREGPHADASDPNKGTVLHGVDTAVLVFHLHDVFRHLLDRGVESDVDALAHQVLVHVAADGLVEHRQEARERLHEGHLEVFGDPGVAFLQVHADEVRELSAKLDARRPAADDDEVEHLLHLVDTARGHGHVGPVDDVQHVLAHGPAVLDLLHEECVLVDARDAEGVGLRADGDDEVVIVQGQVLVAVDLLRLQVHVSALYTEEVDLRNIADGLDDGAGRHDARGAAHQERRVEEEGPGGDHGHIVKVGVQLPHEGHRPPSRAQHDDLLPLVDGRCGVEPLPDRIGDVVKVVVDDFERQARATCDDAAKRADLGRPLGEVADPLHRHDNELGLD